MGKLSGEGVGAVEEENGVNGGIKKWVVWQPKREELLKNSFREEKGFPKMYQVKR